MATLEELQIDPIQQSSTLPAEKNNSVSTISSILSGIGSGLIQIPKGAFSLGATLYDLGAGTNKAVEIEKYFDDLTELDEKAEATTAGKITQALVNLGVPGVYGFKLGSTLARNAITAKKTGNYFTLNNPSLIISPPVNAVALISYSTLLAESCKTHDASVRVDTFLIITYLKAVPCKP